MAGYITLIVLYTLRILKDMYDAKKANNKERIIEAVCMTTIAAIAIIILGGLIYE